MKAPGLIPRPIAHGLIVVIAVLWSIDVLAKIVDPAHEINTTVGTAFMLVAGLLGGFAKDKEPPAAPDGPPPDVPPDPPPAPPDPPARALVPDAVPFHELAARLARERDGRP